MSNDLEEMLNSTFEEVLVEKEEAVYIFCPSCERRMNSIFFEDHAVCHTCRGVDAYGNKIAEDIVY